MVTRRPRPAAHCRLPQLALPVSLLVGAVLSPARAADIVYDDGVPHTFSDGAAHSFPADRLIVGQLNSNNSLVVSNGSDLTHLTSILGHDASSDNNSALVTGA